MIELDSVGVERGGKTVLDGVSLAVSRGELLAVVGPNGAGKTTLLRTCNGLIEPDEGTVSLDGADVTTRSAREIARLVATVPQETQLAFDFDVEDVVAMGRTPHRSRFATADEADRDAVESALERTETARFSGRSVGSLSGGERQRVVLARALAQRTPALLFDEPTASLDINHAVRTLSMASGLAGERTAVLAAVHDLDLAARFCDRLALVANGGLLAVGPPEAVLTSERLETAFGVRAAVGTNPVTGTATVTPLSADPPRGYRVHVVGGGEAAARTLGRLADAGFEITAGVLPAGDVAAVTARSVARDVVTARAFAPIGREPRSAAKALLGAADAVVVAGPTADANAELVGGRSGRVFATDAAPDPPSNARVVAESELVAALDGEDVLASASSA